MSKSLKRLFLREEKMANIYSVSQQWIVEQNIPIIFSALHIIFPMI